MKQLMFNACLTILLFSCSTPFYETKYVTTYVVGQKHLERINGPVIFDSQVKIGDTIYIITNHK